MTRSEPKKPVGRSLGTWAGCGILFRPNASARDSREKQLVHYPLAAAIAAGASSVPSALRPGKRRLVLNGLRMPSGRSLDLLVCGDTEVVVVGAKYGGSPASLMKAAEQVDGYARALQEFAAKTPNWIEELHAGSYGKHIAWAQRKGADWALGSCSAAFQPFEVWQERLRQALRAGSFLLTIACSRSTRESAEPAVRYLRDRGWRAGAITVTPARRPDFATAEWLVPPHVVPER